MNGRICGRRTGTAAPEAGGGLQLLPLLDLLFATIGILIVVMLVQRIASVEVGRPYATDAMLACTGETAAVLHPGPGAEPIPLDLTEDSLSRALARVSEKARVNVLVGLAASCASRYNVFERVSQRLSAERRQLFRFSYVPMEPPEETLDGILREWRGEPPDG